MRWRPSAGPPARCSRKCISAAAAPAAAIAARTLRSGHRLSVLVHDEADPLVPVVIAGAVQARMFARAALAQHRDLPVLHQFAKPGDLQAKPIGDQPCIDLDFQGSSEVQWNGRAHRGLLRTMDPASRGGAAGALTWISR